MGVRMDEKSRLMLTTAVLRGAPTIIGQEVADIIPIIGNLTDDFDPKTKSSEAKMILVSSKVVSSQHGSFCQVLQSEATHRFAYQVEGSNGPSAQNILQHDLPRHALGQVSVTLAKSRVSRATCTLMYHWMLGSNESDWCGTPGQYRE